MENTTAENSDPGVLYLDADTEITEAIEKLKKSPQDEVRVVVPSRSGLLQSLVNVKLLKKAAKDSNKELVLVTNDKITKNLAGSAGLAVASGVKAMAHIPSNDNAPIHTPKEIEIAQEQSDDEPSESPKQSPKSNSGGFEAKRISLSDDDDTTKLALGDEASELNEHKKAKKVPNYGKLNKRIWLGAGAVALIVGFILLYVFVPTAKATLLAKAKKTTLDFNFILDAMATSSDSTALILASQKLSVNKDIAFDITATGKKEVGNKATGTIAVRNCDDVATHSLPAGTTLTGSNKSFITAQAVTLPAGSAAGGVVNCSSAVDVQITATATGESYNLGTTNFSLSGFSSLFTAIGQTSGGLTKIITVLSAEDITNAQKQAEQQSTSAKDELIKKAGSDMQLFVSTIQADFVDFNTSVKQDAEADKVSVTTKVRYTGFAAKNSDIDTMFAQQIKDTLKGNKQVYQNGAKDGKYAIVKQFSADKVQLNVISSAYYGDPIDKDAIAKSITGKARKEVADTIKQKYEQISGVEIETWPSLMPTMPLLSGKITIDIRVTTD